MQTQGRWKRLVYGAGIGLCLIWQLSGTAAALYSSTNYETNEVFFGNGGADNLSSTNYEAQVAVGETGVGNSKSTDYQANSGFNTTDLPTLQLNVNGGTFDLGTLTTTTTASTSTTFTILDYLSSGYTVELVGDAPSSPSHSLTALSSPTLVSPGTEQFGVNLAANSSPSIGSVPSQIPDSTFSYGQVTSNYSTTNKFMFSNGDTIAQSLSASGETQYTLSVIANISSNTPAGFYGGNLDILVIPKF